MLLETPSDCGASPLRHDLLVLGPRHSEADVCQHRVTIGDLADKDAGQNSGDGEPVL